MFSYKYSILDLEYTSWKGSLKRNWSLSFEQRHIIQLASLKFDNFKIENYKQINKFFSHNKLSNYFQILTKINQRFINDYGKNINNELFDINNFFNNVRHIFCIGHDKEILELNEKYINKKFKFKDKIIDIRPYLAEKLKISENEVISSQLPRLLNIKNNNTPHNALEDVKCVFTSLKYLNDNKIINLDRFSLEY